MTGLVLTKGGGALQLEKPLLDKVEKEDPDPIIRPPPGYATMYVGLCLPVLNPRVSLLLEKAKRLTERKEARH